MLEQIGKKYLEAKQDYERLDKEAKEAGKKANGIMYELIQEMEKQSIQSFKNLELGKSFSVVNDISVKKTDEELVFAWLRNTGNDGAIKPTIHASTFKGIVKGYLKKTGLDVPGTEISTFQRINMRSAK